MPPRDAYESLLGFYQFQTGPIPQRERLKAGLAETISEEEARIILLLPFAGAMKPEKLYRKAEQSLGLDRPRLEPLLDHLLHEAFILRYTGKDGLVYERAFCSYMAEQQVRIRKGTPLGQVYAQYWDDLSTISIDRLPTRTPYYRVMAVEETVTRGSGKRTIPVGEDIVDPRGALPIDVISEMVRKEPLIAVAECYCRLSQGMLGRPCSHPKETCFTFNELAQPLIEIGLARRIEADEAIAILREAEKAGLIHNVDNCEGHLKSMCNCCPCCCPAVKAYQRGVRNVGAPSRFRSEVELTLCTGCEACLPACAMQAIRLDDGVLRMDGDRCIGCGQCASACPEEAIRMVPRAKPPRPAPTNDALWSKIRREAMIGMVTSRVFGRRPRASA
jgi:Pyruvate/2-oxoacid:ferredoxin oxidoreductase delta subunit